MTQSKRKGKFSYKNREIDWLSFNERVLQEAVDARNPVYERLKFLAIFSSNLDEFFRVRISKLRQIKKVKKKVRRPLGLRPNRILKILLKEIDAQQQRFGNIFRNGIVPELAQNNIFLVERADYSETQKAFLRQFYERNIADKLKVHHGRNYSVDSFLDGELYLVGRTYTYSKIL